MKVVSINMEVARTAKLIKRIINCQREQVATFGTAKNEATINNITTQLAEGQVQFELPADALIMKWRDHGMKWVR